ncbi:hypothetical protein [Sulfurospirillum oryzae]|uniref:hypothetical protein n=1 Tax=Sulfurospirillum oryzae TaxID=2976535 RepID=UPI0021E75871|nr:hypothetical protein [Sulfurospirillum oryzae]
MTATEIGKLFNKTSRQINDIFQELHWIEKNKNGWVITESGKSNGAIQINYRGSLSVQWDEKIQTNILLKKLIEPKEEKEEKDFRERYPATHRTKDGHFVRSKAEMIIDDWLYSENIVHAYEKMLPIQENVYSDFYLPQGKVYIEFWGLENDQKYNARKEQKKEIYKKHNVNLIELTDKEIAKLDDVLPRMLIKYGINII